MTKTISNFSVTASHLPEDKNGLKFFTKYGGLEKSDVDELIELAKEEAYHWYDMGIVPPSSGNAGVLCSELVSFSFHRDSCMFCPRIFSHLGLVINQF